MSIICYSSIHLCKKLDVNSTQRCLMPRMANVRGTSFPHNNVITCEQWQILVLILNLRHHGRVALFFSSSFNNQNILYFQFLTAAYFLSQYSKKTLLELRLFFGGGEFITKHSILLWHY